MNHLSTKTALVTGGTKGIGYGVAEALLKAGFKVAITSRTRSAAEKAAKALGTFGDILAVEADVRSAEAQQIAVSQVVREWGGLGVLVANAGIGHFGSIETLTSEQWNETIDINLTGVFNSVKAAIPPLKNSKGYIITIASLAGTNFFAGGAAYNASKFGLVGFTQAIMMDLRGHGIKVSTIMPGSVATEFNNHKPSQEDAWKIQPEDIGQMVVDMLNMNPRTLPSKIEVRPSMPGKG